MKKYPIVAKDCASVGFSLHSFPGSSTILFALRLPFTIMLFQGSAAAPVRLIRILMDFGSNRQMQPGTVLWVSAEEGLKRFLKKYGILLSTAAILIALDQWTKYLVRTTIPYGGTWMPWEWLAPYARIVHWTNNGVAFGMFQGAGIIFTLLSLAVIGAIIYYYPQIPENQTVMRLALGFQLGGAIGNLIDRVFHHFEVTDFISVGNFAVFNIADASITVGVIILIIAVWVDDSQKQKRGDTAVAAGTAVNPDERENDDTR